jgi:threonine dehydrogenase-like Zn-dependent dehydrogenase
MPEPGSLELTERELTVGPEEVLVETHRASICDADLRAWKGLEVPGDMPEGLFEYPGHEGAGTVLETGAAVTAYDPGDRVMLFGPNNSFASHFLAPPDSLQPAPEEVSMATAALGEPACVGIYGVFESGAQPGDHVLVAGLNFQGLVAVQGLKAKGAHQVIAVDHREPRLETAARRGADVTLHSERDDVAARVAELTGYNADEDAGGHRSGDAGVDVSLHSCGYWDPNQEAYLNLCIATTRDEGTVCSIPDVMDPATVDLHRVHHHGMDLRFPALMHHGPEFLDRQVPRLMKPLAMGTLEVESLVTAEYPISEAGAAMERYAQDDAQVKVALTPDRAQQS